MMERGSVLVTGASTGIGRSSALVLAAAGFQVFAGVRKATDGDALRNDARSGSLTPVTLDVTSPSQIADVAKQIADSTGGRLDGLVNNAGIGLFWPIELVPLEALRLQYEVNVFGQVAVTQTMLPLLRTARGRIVMVGSVGGWITMPFVGPLCSSKHAIRSLNDALRMELSPWGIRVILIEPGAINTDAVTKLEAEIEPTLDGFGPLGRRRYAAAFQTATSKGIAHEKGGAGADAVAKVVLHTLTSSRPRTRYPVGPSARPLAVLARSLPNRALDAIRFRALGIPRRALTD